MKVKLLHPDGQHLALYFPAGLPERGGSCAFASMRCLVNCLSYLMQNNITKNTNDIFDTHKEQEIAEIICNQLSRRKPRLLEWFCWGDCIPERTEQVLGVMRLLSKKGIIQCGFTRNKKLWKASHKIKNMRLGFTTEDIDELDYLSKKGLVAYPNYDTGETQIFYGTERKHSGGSCGGAFYYDRATKISYDAECVECYKNRRGCFTKFKRTK